MTTGNTITTGAPHGYVRGDVFSFPLPPIPRSWWRRLLDELLRRQAPEPPLYAVTEVVGPTSFEYAPADPNL